MSRTEVVQIQPRFKVRSLSTRGDCFKKAMERVLEEDDDGEDKWLVHGYYNLIGVPNCYQLHAWVETPTKIYHHVVGKWIVEENKRDFFDRAGNLLPMQYFNRQEVRAKMKDQTYYGPWNDAFRHDIIASIPSYSCSIPKKM